MSARRASDRLAQIIASLDDIEQISVGDLVDRLGAASMALLVLLLALLALVPLPGPAGPLFGAALAFVGFQVMRSARRIWLPHWMRRQHLPVPLLVTAIRRIVPRLRWLERRMSRRRLLYMTNAHVRVVLGAAIIILAIIIALPIPLGNFMPAIAIMTIALALLERDGAVVFLALGVTLAALAWTALLFVFGAAIISALWQWVGWG